VVHYLRRAGVLPKPKVSRDEALEVARAECQGRGWPWHGRVLVHEGLSYWHFMTNADFRGGNVNIWVDSRTGVIRKAGFAGR
jgi:hypothetical protein